MFAYPNGLAADFDDHAVSVVREAGCSHAVTTIEGPNDAGTDPYRLRRYGIGAEDPLARFVALVHHAPTAFGRLARLVRGA